MKQRIQILILTLLTLAGYNTAWGETIEVSTTEALTSAISKAQSGDVIQLTADINLTAELSIGTTLTLDLNGNVLKQTGNNQRVIKVVNGAALTISDSNPDAEHFYIANGDDGKDGLWVWTDESDNSQEYKDFTSRPGNGSKITVNGGAITGGNVPGKDVHGGGILVDNGSLIISGGNIIGNMAYSGAGVCCHSGSVTQNGGRIVGNALSGNDSGGGVYMQGGTYTLNGGDICFNKGNCGGGVNAGWSSNNFIMTGGKIAYNFGGQGGGVAAYYNGTLTGGVIADNIVNQDNDGQIYGAGVYFGTKLTVGGSIIISGNTLKGSATPNNLYFDNNKTPVIISQLSEDARIGITTHALPTQDSPVTFASEASQSNLKCFSSDLAAYGVTFDNSSLKLTALDYACQIFTGDTEGAKYSSVQDAVNALSEAGKTIKLLRDNILTSEIFIDGSNENAVPAFTLDLNGYVLKQSGYNQGVIHNWSNLTVIDSNPSTTHYLVKSGNDWILQNSQPSGTEGTDYVTVSGGCITGGNLVDDGHNGSTGAGIHNSGTLNLQGGNICGNSAVCGSGVWQESNHICTVGGNVKIKYNTTSNLGLFVYQENPYITIGSPSTGMEIGVTTYGKGPAHYEPFYGRFTAFGTAEGNTTYFFSDDSDYEVKYNAGTGEGGYLETVEKGSPEPPTTNVCQILDTDGKTLVKTYTSLETAISEVVTGQTIQLLADIVLSGGICIAGEKDFTLDLNDHVLRSSKVEPGRVISHQGKELTIVDNAQSKTTRYLVKSDNKWVYYDQDGTPTGTLGTDYVSVSGGLITGGYITEGTMGGGIDADGALNILGGNICGNTSVDAWRGAGVYVHQTGTIGGSAVIKYNNGANLSIGSPITLNSDLTGTESIGITLVSGKGSGKGKITTNYISNAENVFFSDVADYSVAQNAGTGEGAYLELVEGPPTPTTKVCKNTTTGTEYETLSAAIAEVLAGETIKLLKNIDLTEQVSISSGNFTLDLNGHVLHQTTAGQRVIYIGEEANLTIADGNSSAVHYYVVDGDGVWNWNEDASTEQAVEYGNLTDRPEVGQLVAISGGAITGGLLNSESENGTEGAGIFVDGNLTITGGNIIGNKTVAEDEDGGGIACDASDRVISMSGGRIVGNYAPSSGGGIIVFASTFNFSGGDISFNSAKYGGGVNTNWDEGSTFNMTGGNIKYNYAIEQGGGAGIYVNGSLTGGTISGNTVSLCDEKIQGAGVYFGTSLTVGGTITITGNTLSGETTNSNLYVNCGSSEKEKEKEEEKKEDEKEPKKVIKKAGEQNGLSINCLAEGAAIGITTSVAPTSESPVTFASNANESDVSYFSSDNDTYSVEYNEGTLQLTAPYEPTNICKNVDTQKEYETLEAAIEEVAQGETIQLLADIDLSSEIEITSDKNFVLDLNDKVLKQTTSGQRIFVNYGNLTIVDNADEKTTRYLIKNSGAWVLTDNVTKYSVSGGCITGANTESEGGAIWNGGGKLTLLGGNICGNKSTTGGSGVYSVNETAFEVGGTVVVNYNTGTNVSVLTDDQHFNYLTIGTGGNAPQDGMKISVSVLGKGGDQSTGRFTITGIKNDYSQYFLADTPASFQVSFNEVDGGYLELIDAPVVNVCQNVDQKKEYSTLEAAIEAVAAGETIQLISDVKESVTIANSIPAFTLDLNDHVLTAEDGNKAIVNNGNLTIVDAKQGEKTIRYFVKTAAGWSLTDDEQETKVAGGCITGGSYTDASGGAIENNGTLTLSSGNICGNNCIDGNNGHGGGVYNTGTFNMTGGCIWFNTSGESGGGVANAEANDEADPKVNPVFNMTGGSICYNTAAFGGGISNLNTITLKNCEIGGNEANVAGGVVNMNTCTIGGTTYITNNTGGNCVVIKDNTFITLADDATEDMSVGVTVFDFENGETTGQFTNECSESDYSIFFSDDENYSVEYNASGYYELTGGTQTDNVCQILHKQVEPTPYKSIAEAIAAVQAEETIQLIADVTESVTIESGIPAFTLDLNDHVLTAATDSRTIVNNGNLTIVDNAADKTTRYLVKIQDHWNLLNEQPKEGEYETLVGGIITGGRISGGQDAFGGGVYNNGTFTLASGIIAGNYADNSGGGLFNQNGATASITGGKITANYSCGVFNLGTMSLTGGTISANLGKQYCGVRNESGNFTVGGSVVISDNSLLDDMEGTPTNLCTTEYITIGTGDYAPKGMSIGITKNGGGQFTTATEDYSSCFTSDDSQYNVEYDGDGKYLKLTGGTPTTDNVCVNTTTGTEYKTLESAIDEVETDQTIQMLANTTAKGQINLSDKSFTLDLNGKDVSAADGSRLFWINDGASLTITDSFVPKEEGDEGGHINGSTIDAEATDGSIIYNFGTLTINGGIFQDAVSNGAGSDGAITNGYGSYFSMTGGEIYNCYTEKGVGGAIVIQKGNTSAEISGGKINYCGALLGGAIAIEKGDEKTSAATLTISGGEICSNYTKGDFQSGQNMGGAIVNEGVLTITGGNIHDNTAVLAGGIGNQGTLTIGGSAKVYDNIANETASNLTNAPECYFAIGTPEEGMLVGVTQLDASFASTSGKFTTNGVAEYVKYFFSDNDQYKVQFDSDNSYLKLVAESPACEIVETKTQYNSIPSAIEALKENQTIKMLRDIDIYSEIYVPAGTPAFTLDLDGHVLKQNNDGLCILDIEGEFEKEVVDEGTKEVTQETVPAADVTIKDSKYGDENYTHYFAKNGNSWSLTDTQTDYSVKGGVITGGNVHDGADGGAIFNAGILRIVSGNICGNSITTGSSNDGGAIVSSGKFYMSGGEICYNFAESSGGGIIFYYYNQESIISGGKIHDNVSLMGGGIAMEAGEQISKLTISGGEFYNNISTFDGTNAEIGGGGAIGAQGNLTVTGGKFHDNYGLLSGGIGIAYPGSLTMTGGEVYDHKDGTYNAGIGVIAMGSASISGSAKITGNAMGLIFNGYGNVTLGGAIDISGNAYNVILGKGSYNKKEFENLIEIDNLTCENKIGVIKTNFDMMNGNMEMTPIKGQITSNGAEADLAYFKSDDSNFSVAYNAEGYLELVGGTPTPTIDVCQIVHAEGDPTKYETLEAAIKAVAAGETIQLLTDINLDATVNVPAGTPAFTLDLDGKVLNQLVEGSVMAISGAEKDKKEDPDNPGQYIEVIGKPAANVTIKDSKYNDDSYPHYLVQNGNLWSLVDEMPTEGDYATVKGGVITGGNSVGGAINNEGTLTITSGNFCGNSSDGDGGAIAHGGANTTTINGGNFCYNYAKSKGGAVVGLGSSQELLTITGGEFHHNTAGMYGGAVATSTKISITGGTFSNNTATYCGGGLALEGGATASITGGTFSGNTAGVGGGIANLSESTTIGGSLVVIDNTNGNFATTVPVTLGEIGTMDVGIYLGDAKTYKPIAGQFTTNGTPEDIKYFNSDLNDFSIAYNNKGGYLELVTGTEPVKEGIDVAISKYGKATVYSDKNLIVPEGVRVYAMKYQMKKKAKDTDPDEYELAPCGKIYAPKDILKGGHGYVVEGAEGNYTFEYTKGDATKSTEYGDLKGVLDNTICTKIMAGHEKDFNKETQQVTIYVLNVVKKTVEETEVDVLGFYRLMDGSKLDKGVEGELAANRAYYPLITDKKTEDPAQKASFIPIYDFVTNIQTLSEPAANGKQQMFNLAGQQVGNDYKGIVIKNGKKYLNK